MISFVKNIALHYNFDQYYTEELNILVEKIMNKYDFLVIKEEAWESVFKKIIAKTKSLTEIE